jgi:iterative type I PKS product template protein
MVHAEIAYTMARYLYKKLRPNGAEIGMNLQNFEYHEPVVARKSTDREQMIHTEAVLDLFSSRVRFRWFNVEADHWYSCAMMDFESPAFWLNDWARAAHLVTCRIDSLKELADRGQASKLSRQLTYRLFANLVDWSELFQGMQSVVLDRMEAFAEVQLFLNDCGKWYIAPWHMESLVALSAFILNCTEVLDNRNYFFITPGYKSMRFAKPLKPGGLYRSYVKMLPTNEPNMYAGDVYILDGSDVVGMMEGILFRKWPRIMINRFFVPPDMEKVVISKPKSKTKSGDSRADRPLVTKDVGLPFEHQSSAEKNYPYADKSHPSQGKNHLSLEKKNYGYPAMTNIRVYAHPDSPKATPNGVGSMLNGVREIPDGVGEMLNDVDSMPNGVRAISNKVAPMPNRVGTLANGMGARPTKPRTMHAVPKREVTAKSSIVSHVLAIISEETAIDVAELTEDASFFDLGIDSLMSLVLTQKLRSEIDIDVQDSLFIEFPTVRHLCQWLEKS